MYCSLFGTHVPWSPQKLTVVVRVNKWPQLGRSRLRREILYKPGSLHCQHSSLIHCPSILFLGLNSDSTLEILSFQPITGKLEWPRSRLPFCSVSTKSSYTLRRTPAICAQIEHRAHILCVATTNCATLTTAGNSVTSHMIIWWKYRFFTLDCCSIRDEWQAMAATGHGAYHHPGVETHAYSATSFAPNRLKL
jgi:hypothetical protein